VDKVLLDQAQGLQAGPGTASAGAVVTGEAADVGSDEMLPSCIGMQVPLSQASAPGAAMLTAAGSQREGVSNPAAMVKEKQVH
jgi:hypothetical protein